MTRELQEEFDQQLKMRYLNKQTPMENIIKLQEWYLAQCNGDWEHEFGITIGTLDNPGWSLKIDLANTTLQLKDFEKRMEQRSSNDWIFCNVTDAIFNGACGPLNLNELIGIFIDYSNQVK